MLTKFNNGNINLKLEKEDLKELSENPNSLMYVLSENLFFWNDMYFVGEDFCLSNYDMGINVVDANRGEIYVMSYNDMINKLAKGKTVKLYPADYTKEYKQEIWNEFYND
jgi:hypothetical protein